MNSKSKSNGSNLRTSIAILLIAVFAPILAVAGEREKHNPYTVLGMQVRSHLLPDTPGARGEDIGPLVFQEIIPCRFVSTMEKDAYDNPWGGKEFQIMESRSYYPKGVLVSSNGWENPCSEHVPSDSVAVALRLMSYEAPGEGSVYLAPASTYRTQNVPALWFAGHQNEMREATVVLQNDGFSLMVDQTTHLTIDIIGYFQKDPNGYGAQGDKGDKGDRGEKGEKGDNGEAGAQGAQGAQGQKGDKGDNGEAGAQGAQGEKGEKGDRGEAGAQGAQGSKGDKGDRGEAGAQGLKGDKGDKGAQGEKGSQGLQGLKGDKGEKGEKGTPGVIGSVGGPYIFPPGGRITIYDGTIKPNSFILLTYVDVSNGNALGVESVGNGSFVATGSPNKPFKYIVLTVQ